MSLRGSVVEFPLATIVRLVAGAGKTGRLEVRTAAQSGVLGLAGGNLVAAAVGDDVAETALGAVFMLTEADFEFVPSSEPPAANLSGALEALLDRAVVERDQILSQRELIPHDRLRFALSERADAQGEITLTTEQWRTLRAVDGRRDLVTIAQRVGGGRLATLAVLAGLVRAGLVDTIEPPASEPEHPFVPPAEAAAAESAPREPAAAASQWEAPPPSAQWEPAAPPSWESAVPPREPPAPSAPSWEPAAPSAATWEPATPAQDWGPSAPPVAQTPPRADDRLSALADVLGPAEPVAPTWGPLPSVEATPMPELDPRLAASAAPPTEVEVDARLAALTMPAAPQAPGLAATAVVAPTVEPATPAEEPKRKGGLFGGLFGARQEAAATSPQPVPGVEAASRAGKMASFANALLDEYASGPFRKEGVQDHLPELLMLVDEQADPIDRPLPATDDRIDVGALERGGLQERQTLPYLATLVSQIYRDAERALGKDKAKKGYKAARQSVFGADVQTLATPELAGRLPKV